MTAKRSRFVRAVFVPGAVVALWLAAAPAQAQYSYAGTAYNPYTGRVAETTGG
jgi:hypothetical protein